jgi:hypothetical protein
MADLDEIDELADEEEDEKSLWTKTKDGIKNYTNKTAKFVRPFAHYGFVPIVVLIGMNTEPKPE